MMQITEFWYIWYEIFENGKLVKNGRHHRSYRNRGGARRKAYELYGDIPHCRWTVSETCPWEKERRKTNGEC